MNNMNIINSLIKSIDVLKGYYFYVSNENITLEYNVTSQLNHITSQLNHITEYNPHLTKYNFIVIPIYLNVEQYSELELIGGVLIHNFFKEIYIYFPLYDSKYKHIELCIKKLLNICLGDYYIRSSYDFNINIHNNLITNMGTLDNVYYICYFYTQIIDHNVLYDRVIKILYPTNNIKYSIYEIFNMSYSINKYVSDKLLDDIKHII